jgi:hypothetical protein
MPTDIFAMFSPAIAFLTFVTDDFQKFYHSRRPAVNPPYPEDVIG